MDVVRLWDGVGGFIEVGRVPPSCTSWCLSIAWVSYYYGSNLSSSSLIPDLGICVSICT